MKTALLHPRRSTPTGPEPHSPSDGAFPPAPGPAASAAEYAHPQTETVHVARVAPEPLPSDPDDTARTRLAREDSRGEPRWLASVASVIQSGPVPELQAVLLDIIVNPQAAPAEPVVVIHSDEFGEHLVLTPESARRLGTALTTLFANGDTLETPLAAGADALSPSEVPR